MLLLTNTPRKNLEICKFPPIISVSPTSLNFGTVSVGSSRTLSFTIFNLGASSLIVTSLALPFPTYTSDFNSGTIPVGGSQLVNITYTPTANGTQSNSIRVISNALIGLNIVEVTATGFKEIGTALNGVSNWLRSQSNVPTPAHLSAFTYSYRFRTNAIPASDVSAFIQVQEVIGEGHFIRLVGSAGGGARIEFSKRTGGGNQQRNTNVNPILSNTIYTVHVVSNGDASTMKIYVDGVEINSGATANSVLPNTAVNSRRLFGSRDGSIQFFNGTLYYARSYNKVLSLSEIQDEHNTALVPASAVANQLYCWELQDAQNTATRVASVGGVNLDILGFTVGEQAIAQRDITNTPI